MLRPYLDRVLLAVDDAMADHPAWFTWPLAAVVTAAMCWVYTELGVATLALALVTVNGLLLGALNSLVRDLRERVDELDDQLSRAHQGDDVEESLSALGEIFRGDR